MGKQILQILSLCQVPGGYPVFQQPQELLLLTWISNHMASKVCDGITYQFLNFNGCTVEV